MPRLRHLLLRIIRLALRLRARSLALGDGPLLVIAPHPDDESLGCAGLIHRSRLGNRPVACLFLTDGSASHPGHPRLAPESLAARRRVEALSAASLLGVPPEDVEFLGLPDGTLDALPPAARNAALVAISRCIDRRRPATILVTGRRDGSSEHEAAFRLLRETLPGRHPVPRVLEYPVWTCYSPRLFARFLFSPGHVYRLALPGLGEIKASALAAHASQFTPVPPWTQPVQSADFANAFSHDEEFFSEIPL